MSCFGLNPRVRQSGLGAAHHGRISKVGRSHARAMLVEAAWAAAKAPGRCMPSSSASGRGAGIRSRRSRWRAS
ncbi:transposase (plasmid) [Cereibacter azotoformans]|uniref:transposase n=1 Tax=Cereibacter azotoformans TaxID=43057 RepID=UPI0039A24383